MKMKTLIFVLMVTGCLCEPSSKDRVLKDPEIKTDEKHFEGEEHNPEYDHEAFLGKEEAKEFEDLTPEESKERLGKMFDKIDKNHDGAVTEQELRDWIHYVQTIDVMKNVDTQMKESDLNKDGYIDWDEFVKVTNDFVDKYSSLEEDKAKVEKMFKRENRRFKRADADSDKKLTRKEYYAFLHPENHDELKDLVVDETLEDMDKNNDGFLSLQEYIGDLHSESDRKKDEKEPEWITEEKRQFKESRDKNGDGKMDRDEIRNWIIPEDLGNTAEAKHLLMESDVDKDQKLTKKEMVDRYDIFVGSQATNYGEALKIHTEL